MTLLHNIERLRRIPGSHFYDPVVIEGLDKLQESLGICFPDSYRSFLSKTNGCEVFHGYFRIFGLDSKRPIDVATWNEQLTWKFAWNGAASDFWCFGETVFGDQYAFANSDLRPGADAPVYQLHHISMTADRSWADSFSLFVEDDLLVNASKPYLPRFNNAYHSLGPVKLENHLLLVPSLLFLPEGDHGEQSLFQTAPAKAAMIINGDLATQWESAPDGSVVRELTTFVDAKGLTRTRIMWEPENDGTWG